MKDTFKILRDQITVLVEENNKLKEEISDLRNIVETVTVGEHSMFEGAPCRCSKCERSRLVEQYRKDYR